MDPRPYAEETSSGDERLPGLVVVGAVLAFVVGLANFAFGQIGVGIAAAIGGLMAFGSGLSWLAMERRQVRETEREWPTGHSRWSPTARPHR
ncbi:hypothetical protein B8W66_16050 [Mycobacterium decipiens]|uniref:UsfY protein n=1 Tax=Mycobacterium decipiens TaxID=1430326 RepID=A0A1X2LSK0_9MYCO|nr:hypothetical protein B8W66_16050 [Mycobacterium decipiens]